MEGSPIESSYDIDLKIANESEENVYHEVIDDRFNYFILQVKLKVNNSDHANDAIEWAREVRDKVHETFSEWYKKNVSGKKIPKKPVIPKPRQDRIYRKMTKEFEDSVCEVCGDDRVLNIAHIIPRADNGSDEKWNLMRLCANHHQLFDQGMLLKEEFFTIDWNSKDKRASDYALSIRLKAHTRNWAK